MDTLEKRLWDAADPYRANSGQKFQPNSATVLGLIFLHSAQACFVVRRVKLDKASPCSCPGSRVDEGNNPHYRILNNPLERRANALS